MTSTCALILSWYINDSRSFFIWMLLSSSSTFVWLRKLYKTFKQSRHQIEAELLENDHHRNTETMRKTLILRAKYSVSSYPSYTVFSFSSSIIFLVTFFLLGTIWLSQRPYYVLHLPYFLENLFPYNMRYYTLRKASYPNTATSSRDFLALLPTRVTIESFI